LRRFLSPALAVFAAALVASAIVHLQAYGALGELARWMGDHPPLAAAPGTEIELEIVSEAGDPAGDQDTTDSEPSPAAPVAATEPPPAAPRERARPPEPELAVPEPEVTVTPPPTSVRPPRQLQAVQQRSRDPNVETPEDPRFIARDNQRVEEETVARLRNYQRDDEEQSAGRVSRAEAPELGNDDEEDVADAREMEGSEVRTPTEQEARAERPREVEEVAPPAVTARGDTGRAGAAESGSGRVRRAVAGGSGAVGGGRSAERPVIEVDDGQGTFVVARAPERPVGSGPGSAGGLASATGRRASPGRPGEGRVGERGRGRGAGDEGPDLRMSWSELEEVYSPEALRRERETWLRERRSRLRGSNRERAWREFRAAIENYVPNVRPGNQTALNAAASPFADYVAAVHRRIHREFAHRFLRSLPAGGLSPFADQTLNTKLEIILNRNGTVHRIGIVQTSGLLPFDHGAFTAVMRAQPYPEAPSQILSGDGRVYMHWGFYRNERQCGTFNVDPYILPTPPGTPSRRGGPLRDGPEADSVVPFEAVPTWGLEHEPSDDPAAPEGEEPASPPDPQRRAPPEEPGAPPPPQPEPSPRPHGYPGGSSVG